MNNANIFTGKKSGYFIRYNQQPNSKYASSNRNHRKHEKPKQQQREID